MIKSCCLCRFPDMKRFGLTKVFLSGRYWEGHWFRGQVICLEMGQCTPAWAPVWDERIDWVLLSCSGTIAKIWLFVPESQSFHKDWGTWLNLACSARALVLWNVIQGHSLDPWVSYQYSIPISLVIPNNQKTISCQRNWAFHLFVLWGPCVLRSLSLWAPGTSAGTVGIRERFHLLVLLGECNENQEIQKVPTLCFSCLFFLLCFWDSDSSCVHWK